MNSRRLIVSGAIAISVALVIVSCTGVETEPLLDPIAAADISAQSLWERITEESDYTEYSFWPGHEGEKPGQSPHGVVHRIYVNRTLLEGLPAADARAPDGSIVVKDNLNAARELVAITVMAKVEGYAPETGDWFWARYAPDGTVQAAGAIASCIVCHQGVASNDYVIVQQLNAPVAR